MCISSIVIVSFLFESIFLVIVQSIEPVFLRERELFPKLLFLYAFLTYEKSYNATKSYIREDLRSFRADGQLGTGWYGPCNMATAFLNLFN